MGRLSRENEANGELKKKESKMRDKMTPDQA